MLSEQLKAMGFQPDLVDLAISQNPTASMEELLQVLAPDCTNEAGPSNPTPKAKEPSRKVGRALQELGHATFSVDAPEVLPAILSKFKTSRLLRLTQDPLGTIQGLRQTSKFPLSHETPNYPSIITLENETPQHNIASNSNGVESSAAPDTKSTNRETVVNSLVDMGFSLDQATAACIQANGNLEEATLILLGE